MDTKYYIERSTAGQLAVHCIIAVYGNANRQGNILS